jgi:superfamily II DNA or RNA helicase
MSLFLRDYQIECLQNIKNHFRTSNRQLIQMPTGAGKTIIFLQYIVNFSKKSVIVCPTKDLVEQTLDKSKLFFSDIEIHAKTSKFIKKSNHYIVTAASLWRNNTLNFFLEENIDTIILDECHHSCSRTYQHFINKLLEVNPKLKILGFTATPERLDKGNLLKTFDKITFQRNVLDLIEKGHLCDMAAYKIKTGQTFSDKIISGGDFSNIALKDLDNESRNKLIIKTYEENCIKKKTLIFCVNIDHAERLATAMMGKNIKVSSIHGKLTSTQRKYIIEKFRNGEIDVLTNCQLLTEGFDEPSIEAIIIARPTKSKALYCQMVGRGLRNHPGKKLCHLYELADNSHKICTFDVMAFEKKPDVEYPYGVKLTNLKGEIEKLSLEILDLQKEKINIFNKGLFDEFKYMHEIGAAYCKFKSLKPHSPYLNEKFYNFNKIHKSLPRLLDFRTLDFMKKENEDEILKIFLQDKQHIGYKLACECVASLKKIVDILNKNGFDRYNIFNIIFLHLHNKQLYYKQEEEKIEEIKLQHSIENSKKMAPIIEKMCKNMGL